MPTCVSHIFHGGGGIGAICVYVVIRVILLEIRMIIVLHLGLSLQLIHGWCNLETKQSNSLSIYRLFFRKLQFPSLKAM